MIPDELKIARAADQCLALMEASNGAPLVAELEYLTQLQSDDRWSDEEIKALSGMGPDCTVAGVTHNERSAAKFARRLRGGLERVNALEALLLANANERGIQSAMVDLSACGERIAEQTREVERTVQADLGGVPVVKLKA